MNRKKPYNQILFVTTLSLYLGLVLVCAAPEVLAQTEKSAKVVVAFKESGEKCETVSAKNKIGKFLGSFSSSFNITNVNFVAPDVSRISGFDFSYSANLNSIAVESQAFTEPNQNFFFTQISTITQMARASL